MSAAPSRKTSEEGADTRIARVRELLNEPERQQISEINERLADPSRRAQDMGDVLSQAVSLASDKDENLARSLRPSVERALEESTRRNPQMLADAIFPILGPAIRKSISENFQKLVQNLQTTLEHSTSAQGWKWRWEAYRTGKSFAEVVLYHTLLYRVEQVFLIHKETGLMLSHVQAPNVEAQDEDMVSGMLNGIQQFMRDSFQTRDGGELQTLQLDDLTVWIETGPLATIALVVRGQPPMQLRERAQEAVESVHASHGQFMSKFDGDNRPFRECEPLLESLLESEFGQAESGSGGSSFAKAYTLLAILTVGVICIVGFLGYQRYVWNRYFDALRAEPGLVVTEVIRGWWFHHVSGMRDRDSRDPLELLRTHKLSPDRVSLSWEPYVALSDPMILRRAVKALKPPVGVTLSVRDGVLFPRGILPPESTWIEMVEREIPKIAGVRSLDRTLLTSKAAIPEPKLAAVPMDLTGLISQIEGTRIEVSPTGYWTVAGISQLESVRSSVMAIINLVGSKDWHLAIKSAEPASVRRVADWMMAHGVPAKLLAIKTTHGIDSRRTAIGFAGVAQFAIEAEKPK
jgi:hypothetical protein